MVGRISKSDLNLHFKLAGVHQKVPSYDETFEEFWKLLDDGRQGWVDYGFMLEFMKVSWQILTCLLSLT